MSYPGPIPLRPDLRRPLTRLRHWGSTPAERAELLPGDDVLADPTVSDTRSISLAAPPDEVFDWLAQMGFGRAGWYSYDLVDNLGRRSARRIEPDWQVRAAGDEMPAGPLAFAVTHLRRPDHLVLALTDRRLGGHRIGFTLAYDLRPLDRSPSRPGEVDPDEAGSGGSAGTAQAGARAGAGPTGTRLVTRARIAIDGPLGGPAARALGWGDAVMVRRQLLGLAGRCGRALDGPEAGADPADGTRRGRPT